MACFGSCLGKKNRAENNVLPSEDQCPVPCSEIGVFWEFSNFYYDKQTGNVEKLEACHTVPKGAQIELRLNVTCRGENQSTVEQSSKKKKVFRWREEKVN